MQPETCFEVKCVILLVSAIQKTLFLALIGSYLVKKGNQLFILSVSFNKTKDVYGSFQLIKK